MRINHIGIWTNQLEVLKEFYLKYFEGKTSEKYVNPKKGFSSYFLSFEGNTRIEIMALETNSFERVNQSCAIGYAHLAVSVGSKEQVELLTEILRCDGYEIRSEPRFTGDGYFESVVCDPDGNLVEITI